MNCVSPDIDILIPTFQRENDVMRNLPLLAKLIRSEGGSRIRVMVRDNASKDNTVQRVHEFITANPDLSVVIDRNETNIGLEANCVEALAAATAPYVMYLGDDDFIPEGYLTFVLNEIDSNRNTAVVISGFCHVLPDGTIEPSRYESFDVLRLRPSPKTVRQLMPLGHQLSGLVLRREGLIDSYLANEDCRNLYPFIHFVGYNCQQGESVYAPKFQVKVTKGAAKHWSYDRSQLMRHILLNYEAIFKGRPVERWRAQFTMLRRNWGRIGGANPTRLPSAFMHVVSWPRLDRLTKAFLYLLLPFLFVRAVASSTWRAIRPPRLTAQVMAADA